MNDSRLPRRIGELVLGHTVNTLILSYAFDYGLYPFAIWKLGLLKVDVPACVALSIWSDPFITTACLRRGAFTVMTRRDWRIFFASSFIANGWWALVCGGGVEAVLKVWDWLGGW